MPCPCPPWHYTTASCCSVEEALLGTESLAMLLHCTPACTAQALRCHGGSSIRECSCMACCQSPASLRSHLLLLLQALLLLLYACHHGHLGELDVGAVLV